MEHSIRTFFNRNTDLTVGIVTPYLPTVSETFIRGHAERLPAKTIFVYGWPATIGSDPVLSSVVRMSYQVRRRLLGQAPQKETTAGYVAAFRRSQPDVVLAEYGTTGVSTMEACRK